MATSKPLSFAVFEYRFTPLSHLRGLRVRLDFHERVMASNLGDSSPNPSRQQAATKRIIQKSYLKTSNREYLFSDFLLGMNWVGSETGVKSTVVESQIGASIYG